MKQQMSAALCRGDDSQGHIFRSCMHADVSKQYLARHDKAMRTVIQAFTKGQCGSHYLIADVGKIEGLKDIGMHSKRVPAFVLPDRCLQARGLDPMVERGLLQGGAADTRSKMRPDMMVVAMTAAEQQRYLQPPLGLQQGFWFGIPACASRSVTAAAASCGCTAAAVDGCPGTVQPLTSPLQEEACSSCSCAFCNCRSVATAWFPSSERIWYHCKHSDINSVLDAETRLLSQSLFQLFSLWQSSLVSASK